MLKWLYLPRRYAKQNLSFDKGGVHKLSIFDSHSLTSIFANKGGLPAVSKSSYDMYGDSMSNSMLNN